MRKYPWSWAVKYLGILAVLLVITLCEQHMFRTGIQRQVAQNGPEFLCSLLAQVPATSLSQQARATRVLLCDETGASCGVMLGEVRFQGDITGSTGEQTVQINKLTDGTASVELESAVWKYSLDSGSTYKTFADTDYVDDAVGAAQPVEYALRGDGTGSLASATVSPSGWVTSGGAFTFFAVVSPHTLTRAESFYKITETQYSTNVINFGKTADDKLTLIVGSNTYTSGAVFDSTTIGIPVEVGVTCDTVGGTVTFFFAGQAEAEQAATFSYPSILSNEQHVLGDALDGDMFFFSLVKSELLAQNTFHTPFREGLGSASQWIVHYDLDAGEGTSVIDRVEEQRGSGTAYPLTITNGVWTEFARSY